MTCFWYKRVIVLASASTSFPVHAAAVDSYRFLHVTIETPWYIFLFLLMCIFVPFVLMAVLGWQSAARKTDEDKGSDAPSIPD